MTSELRISDAPLASPDVSTLSGSSESSIHNTDSSEQIAEVAAIVEESEDDNSDATFIADSDSVTTTGSITTVIDGLASKTNAEDDTPPMTAATSLTELNEDRNDQVDNDDMKGEKVRAIAAKLSGKLALGGGVAKEENNVDVRRKMAVEGTSESSDTDSVNTTPSDSPAKAKLDGVVLRPPSLTRAKNSGEL